MSSTSDSTCKENSYDFNGRCSLFFNAIGIFILIVITIAIFVTILFYPIYYYITVVNGNSISNDKFRWVAAFCVFISLVIFFFAFFGPKI